MNKDLLEKVKSAYTNAGFTCEKVETICFLKINFQFTMFSILVN